MIDAVLELEHERHHGSPECRTPREAAGAWLGVPEREGLWGLSTRQRAELAANAVIRLDPGEGIQSRVVTVKDRGIGIEPNRLTSTILSLNESNKIQKHYLAGTYGQGGSSTFAFSRYSLIASRHFQSDTIAFTLVKYEDLPAEIFKTGRYVFLTWRGEPLQVSAQDVDFGHGTVVRHFGYDLTNYNSAIGVRSLYGMLQRVMFDPTSAIRFENTVNGWNRTIKGSRNALNGAVDDGDEGGRGPSLDHHVPLFNVDLGDFGYIGVEYWVLAHVPSTGKARKKPAENFVDPMRPIVLTHNGQNQGEISGRILRDEKNGADLPFLQNQGRLICHIVCDRLSSSAKRLLFASTREQSREGYMLERIKDELIGALRSDDELVRLNNKARDESLKERDTDAQKKMRQQVAKLLRLPGSPAPEAAAAKASKVGSTEVKEAGVAPPLAPIETVEPPTYISVVWDRAKQIPFYSGQRRWLRLETDANSDYFDASDPDKSRINIILGDEFRVFATSPLKGGRMRFGVEAHTAVTLKATGSVRVELYRKNLAALSDEREYVIVDPPEPKEPDASTSFPLFDVIAVSGPDDENWEYICENGEAADVTLYASNFIMHNGTLNVYYSEAYPRYQQERRRFERQDVSLASSFQTRYEMWLAVHALLMYQDRENSEISTLNETALAKLEHQERTRLATMAAMIAAQEVKAGNIDPGEE